MADALLGANGTVLSAEERSAIELLIKCGQQHLFSAWPEKGIDDDKKKLFCQHILTLDKQVAGGLLDYVERARKLLADSRADVNPYDGFMPTVPVGVTLDTRNFPDGLNEFHRLESIGIREVGKAAFAMVAGGLGERLGYNGIKIALPSEITTEKTFIQLYVESILALQERARNVSGDTSIVLPLAIMTSGDTDAKTRQLLDSHGNFGMAHGQLTIVKQELVPAMSDNDAHFVLDEADPNKLNLKPHGHGDVHTLLYQYGLSKRWAQEGRKWVVFFQDTNGVVFRAVPAALAVSAEKKLVVNSLTVPRRPGEAVGAICKLESADRSLTINVEYNQLDALMKCSGVKDQVDASGFSKFPGNINVLVFEAQSYARELERTKGVISEFVNPKYKDAQKQVFNKPTRLECMMQDYPKLLSPDASVGFTQLERWTSFSAVKNNLKDAVDKQKSTGSAESGSTGEADMYYAHRKALSFAGVEVDVEGQEREFSGVKAKVGARVVLAPSFACSLAEVAAKIKGHVRISGNSTLVVSGAGVTLGDLDLDGALIVEAAPGAHVQVTGTLRNKGWDFEPVAQGTKGVEEKYLIRGYVLAKYESMHVVLPAPGHYVLDKNFKPHRVESPSVSTLAVSGPLGEANARLAVLARVLAAWTDIPQRAHLQAELSRLQALSQSLGSASGSGAAASQPHRDEWVRKAVAVAEKLIELGPSLSQKEGWPGASWLERAVEILEEWEEQGLHFSSASELAAACAKVDTPGEARALKTILADV